MKKIKFLILIVFFVATLSACDMFGGNTTTTTSITQTTTQTTSATTTRSQTTSSITTEISTTEESALTVQLKYIYNLAVEANAFDGTYEQWLETVRGPQGLPGEDGREVLFRVTADYLQWQYSGDTTWSNLVNLTELKGDAGVGIDSIEINQIGELIIVYTDNSEVNLGVPIVLYTVNFKDYNGYLVDTQRVAYGTAAIEPTTPPRDGYVFTGWDKDFSNVTSNLTVTALYASESYNVVFQNEDGTEISRQTVNYGEAATAPAVPVKPGYTFTGWSHDFTQVKGDLVVQPRYVINVYNVTFKDYNGLIFKVEAVEHGNDASAPIVPERLGYTFIGWDSSFANITSNLIVTATYEVKKYSITFDSNGGEDVVAIMDIPYGSTVTLPIPSKIGYDFNGWYLGNDIDARRFYSTDEVTKDLTLYARWNENIEYYTVTFEPNNDLEAFSELVAENDFLSTPNVEKLGYSLDGWYTSNDNGNTLDKKWIFTTDIIQQNTTLYAKWIISEYSISFVSDGGTEVPSITQNYNSLISKPNDPVRVGYVFAGWYLESTLLNEYDFTVMPANNLILYASWEAELYKLEYQDFDGVIIQTDYVYFNEVLNSYTEPNTPERTGYVFTGWNFDLPATMPASDLILVATYHIGEYTITFEENGGTNVADLTLEFEAVIDLPQPSKEGFRFTGWYIDVELTEEFALASMPANNLLLYAGWQESGYILEFRDFDGSVIFAQEFDYLADLSNFIYPDNPERTGYDFIGWDSSLPINMPNNDLILNALYNVKQYTITFEENGGSLITDLVLDFDSDILLDIPTKEGYTFGGWYLDETFTEEFYLVSMPAENLVLYAKWEVGEYTISYYDMDNLEIGQVFATSSANFVLTLDGQLYGMGLVYLGEYEDTVNTPTKLNHLFPLLEGEMIIDVSGSNHYFVLTSFGRIFALGLNGYGELGDGTNFKKTSPVDITANFGLGPNEFITYIGTGDMHSMALTSEGRVFTWGYNSYGNLGDGTQAHQFYPVDITDRFNFFNDEYPLFIDGGSVHTVLVTTSGRVFTFGWGSQGQLGNGSSVMYQLSPLDITNNFNFAPDDFIVSVNCSDSYTVILTQSGSVFVFGLDSYGKFGVNVLQYYSPTDIKGLIGLEEGDQIIKVAARNYSTMMLSSYGKVYGFGSNSKNLMNAGIDVLSVTETFDFSTNYGFDVADIYLNDYSSVALDFNGNLYGIGLNYSGEIGKGDQNPSTSLFMIPFDDMMEIILAEDYYNEGDLLETFEPVKYGYTFAGWYLDSNLTQEFTLTTMPNYNLQLFAAWDLTTVTITFDSQGGSVIPPLTLSVGDGVLPPIPTKEGYLFAGWYLELDYINEFDFGFPTEDMTVYAKWETQGYFLSFETNGGSIIPDVYFNSGDYIDLPADPTKEGFMFAGWYFDPNFLEEFNLTTMLNENLVIYARWIDTEHIIDFETNGGSTISKLFYDFGEIIIMPDDPVKEGYTFGGWYLDVDLVNQFTLSEMPDYSITLYAAWEANTVTITFDSQGGSIISPVTLLPNEGLAEPIPTKEGFTFAGWYIEPEYVNEFDFSNLPTEDTTIYARWVSADYILSFDTNGGSLISDLYYDFGDTIFLPDNPVKEGHSFAGWYLDFELNTPFTLTTMPDNNLNVYAGWTVNQYTISFEEFGGSEVIDLILDFSASVLLPDDPTKVDYTFGGWYLNSSLTMVYQPGLMPAENFTLYAKWISDSQTNDVVPISTLINGNVGEVYTIQGVVVMTTEYDMILVKDSTGQVFMDNPYNLEIGDEVILTVIKNLRNNLVYISYDNSGILLVEKVATNQDLGLQAVSMSLSELFTLDLTDSSIYGKYIETQGFVITTELMYHMNYALELDGLLIEVMPFSYTSFETLMDYEYLEVKMRAFIYQNEDGSLALAFIGSRGELAIPSMSDEEFVNSLMTTITYYQNSIQYSSFDSFETLSYHPMIGGSVEFSLSSETEGLIDEEGKFDFVTVDTLFYYSITVSRNAVSLTTDFQKTIHPLVITEFSNLSSMSNYSEVMVKGIIVYRHNNYAYLLDSQGNLLYLDIQNLQAYAGDEVIIYGAKKSVYNYTTGLYQEVYVSESEYTYLDTVLIILSTNNAFQMPVIESSIFMVNDIDSSLTTSYTKYYELQGRLIVDSSGDYYLVRGQEFIEILPVDGYSDFELSRFVDQEVSIRGYLSNYDSSGGYFSLRFTGLTSELVLLDLTNLEKIAIVKEVLLHQYNNQTYTENIILELPIAYDSFTEVVVSYSTTGVNASLFDPETGIFSDVFDLQTIIVQATILIDSDFEVVDITINVEPESVITISSISDMLLDMGNEHTIEATIVSMIRVSDGYYLLLSDASGIIFLRMNNNFGFYDDSNVGKVIRVTGIAAVVDGRNEIILDNVWNYTGDIETLNFIFTEKTISELVTYDLTDTAIMGQTVMLTGILRSDISGNLYLEDNGQKVGVLLGLSYYQYSSFINCRVVLRGFVLGAHENFDSSVLTIMTNSYAYDLVNVVTLDQYSSEEIVDYILARALAEAQRYQTIFWPNDLHFMPEDTSPFQDVSISYEVTMGNDYVIYTVQQNYDDYILFLLSPTDQLIEITITVSHGDITKTVSYELYLNGFEIATLDALFLVEPGTKEIALEAQLLYGGFGYCYLLIEDLVYYYDGYSGWFNPGDTFYIIGKKALVDGVADYTYDFRLIENSFANEVLLPFDLSIFDLYNATDLMAISQDYLNLSGILKYDEAIDMYYLEDSDGIVYIRVDTWNYNFVYYDIEQYLLVPVEMRVFLSPEIIRGEYLLVDFRGFDNELNLQSIDEATRLAVSLDILEANYQDLVISSGDSFEFLTYLLGTGVFVDYELVNPFDNDYFDFLTNTALLVDGQTSIDILATLTYNSVEIGTYSLTIVINPIIVSGIGDVFRITDNSPVYIEGIILAIGNDWLIVKDGTGSIYIESNISIFDFVPAIGDEVSLLGVKSTMNNLGMVPVLTNLVDVNLLSSGNTLTDLSTIFTWDDILDLDYTNPMNTVNYIDITGNVTWNGSTTNSEFYLVDDIYGSLYQLSIVGQDLSSFIGETITVTGYLVGLDNYVDEAFDWYVIPESILVN